MKNLSNASDTHQRQHMLTKKNTIRNLKEKRRLSKMNEKKNGEEEHELPDQ
jgi:hypothetical protein